MIEVKIYKNPASNKFLVQNNADGTFVFPEFLAANSRREAIGRIKAHFRKVRFHLKRPARYSPNLIVEVFKCEG
jgi:hypothetical protein